MNERDLHTSFGDLARSAADEQIDRQRRGDGLSVSSITRQSSRARRRRGALTTVAGIAAVTSLVLTGSALADRPEPRPAGTPTTSPTRSTPTPTPAPDPTPDPTPSSPVTSAPPTAPDVTGTTGVLRSYPSAPRAAWTVPPSSIWPAASGYPGALPLLGDVTASPHSYPAFRALAAGGTWLVAAGIPEDEDLVGLGADDGTVRWTLDGPPGDAVDACAGVHDGLLVCQGGGDGARVVQLRDPGTGDVVREAGPGGSGIALAADAVVVHAVTGTDVLVEVRDLVTGAVRGGFTLPGAAGDGVVQWRRAGAYVLVEAPQYSFVVDARSGRQVGGSLNRPGGVRPDGWVTGYAADGNLHAVGPDGRDLTLPAGYAATPRVWAPAPDLDVPLLVWPDPADSADRRVRAVDPASGEVVWSVPGTTAVQAVAGRTVVLVGQEELVAVDAPTGTELWRTPAGNIVGVDGERLVVDDLAGLRAVDLRTGSVAWELALDPTVQVHEVDGTLVAVGADGSLTSLVP
ncbi:PQQ-binding-like beta-propeller repeat protein [Cellulomonas sp. NPDC058312]|uniref:outer membrane protein assembly factor BamB family protein n=1 Tax=Cellulomonas sp. NPDC058312 TaxID=3346441 RepID=UPI0036EE0941